jgi:hypothetical protein
MDRRLVFGLANGLQPFPVLDVTPVGINFTLQ